MKKILIYLFSIILILWIILWSIFVIFTKEYEYAEWWQLIWYIKWELVRPSKYLRFNDDYFWIWNKIKSTVSEENWIDQEALNEFIEWFKNDVSYWDYTSNLWWSFLRKILWKDNYISLFFTSTITWTEWEWESEKTLTRVEKDEELVNSQLFELEDDQVAKEILKSKKEIEKNVFVIFAKNDFKRSYFNINIRTPDKEIPKVFENWELAIRLKVRSTHYKEFSYQKDFKYESWLNKIVNLSNEQEAWDLYKKIREQQMTISKNFDNTRFFRNNLLFSDSWFFIWKLELIFKANNWKEYLIWFTWERKWSSYEETIQSKMSIVKMEVLKDAKSKFEKRTWFEKDKERYEFLKNYYEKEWFVYEDLFKEWENKSKEIFRERYFALVDSYKKAIRFFDSRITKDEDIEELLKNEKLKEEYANIFSELLYLEELYKSLLPHNNYWIFKSIEEEQFNKYKEVLKEQIEKIDSL